MTKTDYDIIIIGGGMSGISLALALAPHDFKICVIEAGDPAKMQKPAFDGKVIAVAYSSKNFFDNIGVWQDMSKDAGEILDIRIIDGDCPMFLHYDHSDIGDEAMGHIVENRYIVKALYKKIAGFDNITIMANESCQNIETSPTYIKAFLKSGQEITAKLLVGADGRRSKIRELSNIPTKIFDYKQTAIVCTIKHKKNHNGVAVEKFLPSGPFAILPMGKKDKGEKSGHYSSLVWTEKTHLAPLFLDMNEVEFNHELQSRFGDWLGDVKLVGKRWSYPLNLILAKNYTSQRSVIIADAAHGMHPIAGQGINVGIRDVASLTEVIISTKKLGLDIGGASALAKYESARKIDNLQMIAVTDFLNRLFSNNIAPVKLARQIGLSVVEKLPDLKKLFMKHAMGVSKDAPELLKNKK